MFSFQKHLESMYCGAGTLGRLHYRKVEGSWSTLYHLIGTGKIELSIETETEAPPTLEQIKRMEEFLASYDKLKATLLNQVYKAYQRSKYPFPRDRVGEMYTLAGVTLKADDDFWVALEPGDVFSLYNHFMRFTVRNGSVIWANI